MGFIRNPIHNCMEIYVRKGHDKKIIMVINYLSLSDFIFESFI